MIALVVVMVLAVAASGCLQIEQKEQALELYQQIKNWLPEGAITNPEVYRTEKVEALGVTDYFWGESPAKTPEEEEGHLWTLYYDNEKLYQYQRMLSVRIDNRSKNIVQFGYWQDNDAITPPRKFQSFSEELDAGKKYLADFTENFIENGQTLKFKTRFAQGRSNTALDQKNHYRYDVGIDPVYEYVSSFRKYYDNPEFRSQALDWLKKQYEQKLGQAFTFSSVVLVSEVDIQTYKDKQYTLEAPYMWLEWRPNITERKQKQLEYLQQIDEVQYKTVADTYAQLYFDYFNAAQIQAAVKWNGKLDLANAQLFYQHNGEWKFWKQTHWEQKEEELQIKWTAASFANAYGRKYRDAMALFGNEQLLSFPDYGYRVDQAELLRACKIKSELLDGQTPVKVQQGVSTDYDGQQYLDLTLEKIENEWQVTDAVIEK